MRKKKVLMILRVSLLPVQLEDQCIHTVSPWQKAPSTHGTLIVSVSRTVGQVSISMKR